MEEKIKMEKHDENFPGYDRTDPKSIENYSKKLIGKSFREILEDDLKGTSVVGEATVSEVYNVSHETSETNAPEEPSTQPKKNKGNLGQIVEEHFFHYAPNSDSRADFFEAGVELKTTPYKTGKKGELSAKERLVLGMIDYAEVVKEDFETGHFWSKSRLLLLVYYHYKQEVRFNLDYRIGFVGLFTPPEKDLTIIRQDYYVIVGKIKAGLAHELSESDTLYLGAVTKASSSKVVRKQPFSDVPAKPRAFAYKTSYMTYVLRTYIQQKAEAFEEILPEREVSSFEGYVCEKILRYRGRAASELMDEFGLERSKNAKHSEALLAYRLLGIKGNHAEEFEKANIVVKVVRIGNNDRIREHMSFPTFKFKELADEEWENACFGNYLRETRFLLVVYKYDKDGILRLRGCQFWNVPYNDLEEEVRKVWEKARNTIREGLVIGKKGKRSTNNLPKASENPVCHVRPHGKNAADLDELPDGRTYAKQCFWLNKTYIYSQIDDELKFD